MFHRGYARPNAAFKAMVVCCALLVGLALSVEAVHFHPDGGATNEKHCSLCSGAHFAVPMMQAQVTGNPVAAAACAVLRPITGTTRGLPFHLFRRPPPAV